MSSKMPPPASRRGRHAPWYRYSRFWFALAIGSFLVSTILAAIQIRTPRDPYDVRKMSTLDGWLRPIDPWRVRNLQTIETDLRTVAVSKDGTKVWVGGNSGFIAVSTDDGATWRKEAITKVVPAASVPTTAAVTETASATANSAARKKH
jgi:hypothetical protein